jgi:hypothetical protein
MNIKRGSSIIIIFFLVVLSASCQSQKEVARKEMKEISGQIEKLENIILGNNKLTQKLKMHESRLKVIGLNPEIYRVPVLVEGKSIYTICDELEIEDMSNSLALEDLLEIRHSGKGAFRSDDPSVWKNYLIGHSKGASGHILNVELPTIQKRIAELQQENHELGSKKDKLLKKYMVLQFKVQGT